MKNLLYLFLVIVAIGCSGKNQDDPMKKVDMVDVRLPSVKCEMCEETIKKAVFTLEGVKAVDIDLKEKVAHIKYVSIQTNVETIERTITDAGYDADDKKRDQAAYDELPSCCKIDG